jgi:hypothetical protein
MRTIGTGLIAAAALCGARADAAPLRAADVPGTYELVDRTLADGKVLRPPQIAGLYFFRHGRGSLNLFLRKPDRTWSSESSIMRYTLNETRYCEWILNTTRKDLDAPGVTNEAPKVADHCSAVRIRDGRVVFAPPGESVTTTFDRHGFTAVIKGEFTDRWRKLD